MLGEHACAGQPPPSSVPTFYGRNSTAWNLLGVWGNDVILGQVILTRRVVVDLDFELGLDAPFVDPTVAVDTLHLAWVVLGKDAGLRPHPAEALIRRVEKQLFKNGFGARP